MATLAFFPNEAAPNTTTIFSASLTPEYATGSLVGVEFEWMVAGVVEAGETGPIFSYANPDNIAKPVKCNGAKYNRYAGDASGVPHNRVEATVSDPYKVGFGEAATGGNANLVVVTNENKDGAGSFNHAVENASAGDYIIFASNVNEVNAAENSVLRNKGNITIDGQKASGDWVKIVADGTNIPFVSPFRYEGPGNLIIRCLDFDNEDTLSSSLVVGTGEDVWLDQVKFHSPNDDSITLGLPGEGADSVSMVTVSRASFSPTTSKQIQLNMDGNSCEFVNTAGRAGVPATDQTRGFVTVHSTQFNGKSRALSNSGGRAHAFSNYWDPNPATHELMWTAAGGKTISEHGCYRFLNTLGTEGNPGSSGIYATDGRNHPSAGNDFQACKQISHIYTRNNYYIDGDGNTSNTIPPQHTDIRGQSGSTVEDGEANWTDPFTIPYDWSAFAVDPSTLVGFTPASVASNDDIWTGGAAVPPPPANRTWRESAEIAESGNIRFSRFDTGAEANDAEVIASVANGDVLYLWTGDDRSTTFPSGGYWDFWQVSGPLITATNGPRNNQLNIVTAENGEYKIQGALYTAAGTLVASRSLVFTVGGALAFLSMDKVTATLTNNAIDLANLLVGDIDSAEIEEVDNNEFVTSISGTEISLDTALMKATVKYRSDTSSPERMFPVGDDIEVKTTLSLRVVGTTEVKAVEVSHRFSKDELDTVQKQIESYHGTLALSKTGKVLVAVARKNKVRFRLPRNARV